MVIQVQVNDEEIEIVFHSIGEENYIDSFGTNKMLEKWKGESTVLFTVWVEFLSDGLQVIKIDFSDNIVLVKDNYEATKNLLITRIQESLKEVFNVRESGVEYTGEPSGITTLSQPKPYDPDKIKVRQDKFSVDYVVNKMIGRGLIDLNPDFQRKFVWDKKRQSNLIESLMLGIPIPVFYLAEGLNGTFHVIDGLQRLSTLRDFLNNSFYLRNLEHLSNYDGCFYNNEKGAKKVLQDKMLTRIETAQLHFNIIEATSPPEVKFDIFTRLNTGGQPLNNQEVRNCLAEIHVRSFLHRCAESKEFRTATGYSIKNKRMEDQEMVLRFAGFYLQKINVLEYSGDMTPFLNDVLGELNKSSINLLKKIEEKFLNAMKIAYHLFGSYTFRKCTKLDLLPSARKQYINKSMYVVWSILLADLDLEKIKSKILFESFASIVAEKMIFIDEKNENYRFTDYYWLFTSGTSDKKSLNTATSQSKKILDDYI
ncbi:DUF262 domain-containing protein [uncultured Chryseobacterium sp.]|uniref:DUF262 domain-containing protein n=1 Tax=uncultured Chryseobacterium sp. TaxID=259322 RepID=UPI0025D6E91A|nr:DUF262 domain-containing protein [uncultured Chryseobacterium sp.]